MSIPDTGRVVNCDTPEPLVEAILDLLSDPERLVEMGRRGRAWVEERFDWPKVAANAAGVFEGLDGSG
jgi:phosphatidylinositol alpha-1,6-mannosyltransferase